MPFVDRVDAGRRLAESLAHLRDEDVVVLGLARGGVPVAFEVAEALDAPLDVVVVRKLGVPFQPELAMGAVGEGRVRVLNPDVIRAAGVSEAEIATVEHRERAELERRTEHYRRDRPGVPLAGRTAVVVDDGLATGATARVACRVARAEGAARVVVAAPVGSPQTVAELRSEADEVVCLERPDWFVAIGQFYDDFGQVADAQVLALLDRAARGAPDPATAPPAAGPGAGAQVDAGAARAPADPPGPGRRHDPAGRNDGRPDPPDPPVQDEDVVLDLGGVSLAGRFTVPDGAQGVVVFAHGSGSSRHSPRNRYVAATLNHLGLATLLLDLLTPPEERDRANVFDIELLAHRLVAATAWLRTRTETRELPVGYFGASTGAAAALWAAAEQGTEVAAVVSRGGRADLAAARLAEVRAPTLLVVGGNDRAVLDLNRRAQASLACESHLAVVPGASHLFEEPGALHAVADLAGGWFARHLRPGAHTARGATRGGVP